MAQCILENLNIFGDSLTLIFFLLTSLLPKKNIKSKNYGNYIIKIFFPNHAFVGLKSTLSLFFSTKLLLTFIQFNQRFFTNNKNIEILKCSIN